MQNHKEESDAILRMMHLMNLARLIEIYSQQGDDKAAAETAREYARLLIGDTKAAIQ